MQSPSKDVADTAIDAGMAAADTLANAASGLQQTGERLSAQAAELGDNLKTVGGHLSKAVGKSMKDQPMTTLGVAVAAGLLLGDSGRPDRLFVRDNPASLTGC